MTMTTNQPNLSTICNIPWNHVAIQQNGDFRACCQCIKHPFGFLTDENNKPMNIITHTIDEARNSIVLKDMRAAMMRDEKPAVCNLCWEEESSGMSSRRMQVNIMFDEPNLEKTQADGTIDVVVQPVEYMDIRFGNLCNQACRSCGPTDSSLWYEEFATNQKDFSYYGNKTYNFKNKGSAISIDSDDFIWYNKPNFEVEFRKNLKNIKRLYFTGGEPTINKAHYNALQICIDEGVAGNITLDYNSNLMAIPDHLLEKWAKFNLINIGASIDAYGDLANYVRYPSIWLDMEKNILSLDKEYPHDNIKLGLSSTISILNIVNFLELTEWMLKTGFAKFRKIPAYHMLHGPSHLNVQHLPKKTKKMIEEKYEEFFEKVRTTYPEYQSVIDYYRNIIVFMNAKEENNQEMRAFFQKMFKSDVFRKQNIFTYVPWMTETWRQINE